jgi:hypothetical protein
MEIIIALYLVLKVDGNSVAMDKIATYNSSSECDLVMGELKETVNYLQTHDYVCIPVPKQ